MAQEVAIPLKDQTFEQHKSIIKWIAALDELDDRYLELSNQISLGQAASEIAAAPTEEDAEIIYGNYEKKAQQLIGHIDDGIAYSLKTIADLKKT